MDRLEKRRQYFKDYQAKNRLRISEYKRIYYLNNKERYKDNYLKRNNNNNNNKSKNKFNDLLPGRPTRPLDDSYYSES